MVKRVRIIKRSCPHYSIPSRLDQRRGKYNLKRKMFKSQILASVVTILLIGSGNGLNIRRAISSSRRTKLSMISEIHEPLMNLMQHSHNLAPHDIHQSMLLAAEEGNKFFSAPPGAFSMNPFASNDAVANVGSVATTVGSVDAVSVGSTDIGSVAAATSADVSPYSKIDKSGIIGGAANIIETIIDFFHSTLNNIGVKYSYGFSIIAFTMIIKALTLPLTTAQLESTTKMQRLTPLQQKINAKYSKPEDEQTKNQLLSQLFQAANVNPLAGIFEL